MKKTILPLFLFLCAFYVSNANHAAGGELTYSLVPGQTNQYQFILKFYKDCANGVPPNIMQLCYGNNCGATTQSVNMNLYAPQGVVLPNGHLQGDPVPIGCVGGNSTCNGGVIPGYQEWWYTGTVTLPGQCNSWKFWTFLCCRNNILVNVATGQNFFVEATLDNTNNQNLNSSPYFSNYPIPYVCLNTPFSYNYGVIDPDGDSLVYSVIEPRSIMGCGNYTPTNILAANFNIVNNPFPTNNTFNINPATGVFSYLPTASGPYVLTIKVSEYRNGNLIGYVLRDVQFYVNTCQLPPSNITQLVDQNNITGGKYLGGEIISCAGDSLHFCYNINSTNPVSELMLTDNATNVLTGATVSYQNMHTDSVTTCISWLPTIADTGLHTITIYSVDSACMLAGQLAIDTEIVVVHVKSYITPVISISANINQGATNDPIIYTAVTNCTVLFDISWYRNNTLAYTSNNTVWNDFIVAGNNNVYAIIKDPDMCLLPDSAISSTITIQNIPNNVNNIVPDNFKLYPNPTSGKLSFDGLEYGDNIKVYSFQGMLLYNETVSAKTKTINIQRYSSGMYNVAVQRKDKYWTMKFEKQ